MAANIRLLRRRIKTAKNISQITKAMEMVAASKVRRAQEQTLAGKPYAAKLGSIVQNLIGKIDDGSHAYLRERENGKILILLFSSDKGLAGSLNTNMLREYFAFARQHTDCEVITIGKKLEKAVVRHGGILLADFPFGRVLPSFESILPVASLVVEGFISGTYREVVILYTQFLSIGRQKTIVSKLLPIQKEKIVEQGSAVKRQEMALPYKFEPNASELLTFLMPHYLEMTLYQVFLESYASEQAARMIAMHMASENAKDVIWDLSLTYNKARQERITNELLDITGASLGVVA